MALLLREYLSGSFSMGPRSDVGRRVSGVINGCDDVAVTRQMSAEEGSLPPVSPAGVRIEHQRIAPGVNVRVAHGCLVKLLGAGLDGESVLRRSIEIEPGVLWGRRIPNLERKLPVISVLIERLPAAYANGKRTAHEGIVRGLDPIIAKQGNDLGVRTGELGGGLPTSVLRGAVRPVGKQPAHGRGLALPRAEHQQRGLPLVAGVELGPVGDQQLQYRDRVEPGPGLGQVKERGQTFTVQGVGLRPPVEQEGDERSLPPRTA